jgi:hypothetical protein
MNIFIIHPYIFINYSLIYETKYLTLNMDLL